MRGGISTPLIMYWKENIINPGSITDFPSHLIDIMPTLLEVTGVGYPERYDDERINPVDGISLLPLSRGIEPQRNAPLFWQWANGKAIRKGKWKLVSDHSGPWELYDMETDQTETNDLTNEFPEIAGELRTDWENWLNENNIDRE
jgi:arylsulfatase